MDQNLQELVQKILWAVSFIAIGGALAVMFFLVFAQSILGSRAISTLLEKLLRQNEEINQQLRRIAEHLQKEQQHTQKKSGNSEPR
jgi:ABC-type uncharacterized transport system permease subunit